LVLLHEALIYSFVTGTAHRVMRAIARAIETKVIVDTKPLPPSRTPPPKLDSPLLFGVELPYIPVPAPGERHIDFLDAQRSYRETALAQMQAPGADLAAIRQLEADVGWPFGGKP